MHASQRLRTADFGIQLCGVCNDAEQLIPDWNRNDRLGVVSHSYFDAIGASLLIQTVVAYFYEFDDARRAERAQYPPLFLFHVGGRHGDYSPMDFWPPRREIFLPSDPYEVLGAILDRGITRLLVPETKPSGLGYIERAPSGWTDKHAAMELLASCFVFDASGRVKNPDVRISANNKDAEQMVIDALEPYQLIANFERFSDEELLHLELGPSVPSDFIGWLESFRSRAGEVPLEVRKRLLAARSSFREEQHFRRITWREALERLVP